MKSGNMSAFPRPSALFSYENGIGDEIRVSSISVLSHATENVVYKFKSVMSLKDLLKLLQ